ncbi:hypothetical protein BT96DRAFT_917357 [Gymnopus androsaceus JB14]|uniref:VHS domain-containing protein n=1 Tax=Gymnopus androsaceus JB14 TaxID=1447944 RepID=A0A6A4I0F7_9AGAR|nr:hypothetical protein BT96DRAFT_917357 [Gymnopus androsaceus JB14]
MLRNSSDVFITQCTSRKFLDTLEDLLTNTGGGPFSSGKGTSPVVRERVMDVLAAAAYASGTKRDTGFRGLWRKVKPVDKPDEGIPFDTDDAMFNPPVAGNGRGSYYETNPPSAVPYDPKGASVNVNTYYDPTNTPQSGNEHKKERGERDRDRDREGRHKEREHRDKGDREHRHKDREHRDKDKEKKSSRNRIIPLEEDIRRLFQECKIGLGNAGLLSQALVHAKVEELKKGERGEVIKEFRLKCLSSQELIAAQIPWATAGAERSRREKEREMQLLYGETNDAIPRAKDKQRTRDRSIAELADAAGIPGRESPVDEQTIEEKLLAALLEANGELLAALVQYDDLQRVAIERKTEEKSRKETRMDRRAIATLEQLQQVEEDASTGAGGSAAMRRSRSRSPSPAASNEASAVAVQHPFPQHPHSLLPHPAQQLAAQHPPHTHSPEIPGQTLAPPRAPPHGPRSPASMQGHARTGSAGNIPSRTPSPNTPSMDSSSWGTGTAESVGGSAAGPAGSTMGSSDRDILNGLSSLSIAKSRVARTGSRADESDEDILTPIKPSAKALGKRRIEVGDDPEPSFNPDDLYYDHNKDGGSTVDSYNPYAESDIHIPSTEGYNSESDDSESAYYPDGRPRSRNGILHHLHHPPVHFVYDAAAERTRQRIREMEMERSVEGVH